VSAVAETRIDGLVAIEPTVHGDSRGFLIESFFDVFTDISIDGGVNWTPSSGPDRGGSTTMTLTNGTIGGSDNIAVSGLFTFDGGVHSGSGTTTANGGLSVGSATFKNLARVLIVPVSATGTYSGIGGMSINPPGVLTNNGTFEHQTDADVGGSGLFNNTGTFNRTNSAGQVTYSCAFNNTGAVDVQTGELRLTGNGVDTGDYDCTGA